MHRHQAAEIVRVVPRSIAHTAGIVPGDKVVSINGQRVSDVIDLMFYGNEGELEMVIERQKKRLFFSLSIPADQEIGIELRPFKIRTCTNKCIFCFVNQLPKGLRKSLSLKDEDYRMSFLYGNYITLTNLNEWDKKRIVAQRLSPIFISVHSTNRKVRNFLLGNPKAPDIMKELSFFKEHRIRMHCQIVLCPGYNDGKELVQTIRDLYKFHPYVSSIAVVPVGLTTHRKSGTKVRPVEKDDALRALETVDFFQRRSKKRHGEVIVYGADELYIKGGVGFPPLAEYGELPQLENGVGMVPLFQHEARRVKIPKTEGGKRFVTFTGTYFYPFLKRFIDRLRKEGINIGLIWVENTFFGTGITVTGLLTGRDVIKSLAEVVKKDDLILIPGVVMKQEDDVFLDDVSKQDIENLLGARTVIIESTPKGLVEAIAALS
jgi:putative radical SAM enzyme (TIGR03279 family)